MKKTKKIKIIIVGVVTALLVVGIGIFIFMESNKKVEIIFQKGVYEYGANVNFENMIKEVSPDDTKIEYPDVDIKEVGQYNVTFVANRDEIKHSFVVTDTQSPSIELNKSNDPEIIVGTEYDVASNFKSASDKVDGDYEEFEKVDDTEFKKRKGIIEDARAYVNKRDNTTDKKTKEVDLSVDTKSEYVFYTTNLDILNLGTYKVKAVAVDKNFNMTVKEWNVVVKAVGSIVNTGGVVSCDFTSTEQNNEKVVTSVKQVHDYNDSKIITKITTIATYELQPNYVLRSNMDIITNGINELYGSFEGKEGVTMNTEIVNGNTVVFTLSIDINSYNFAGDGIPFFPTLTKGITIDAMIKESEKNSVVCDSK